MCPICVLSFGNASRELLYLNHDKGNSTCVIILLDLYRTGPRDKWCVKPYRRRKTKHKGNVSLLEMK